MAHTQRNIVLAALGAVVIGGLVFVTVRPEPIPVDLHDVERADFAVTVDVDGETRVSELYEVAAPISGFALRSPLKVGDPVIGGETVVARVEPSSPGLLDERSRLQAEAHVREMEAVMTVALSDKLKAEEDLAYARTQYDRVAQLVERNVATITRLEDVHQQRAIAEAALQAAEARIAQAESGLDAAKAALVEMSSDDSGAACCVPILAPADGVVLEVDVVSARPVTAGTRLLALGDPGDLEIVADILSTNAVKLPENAKASVERWGGPVLEAQLDRIEPAASTKVSALGIEEQRVDAIFTITSPPDAFAGLGHGFAVYLRIVEFEANDVLVIPLNAAFRVGTDWAVFRAVDDRVERVPVELGRRNGRYAVVLSGLEVGDRVVEHPSERLTDGALIVERASFATE